MSKNHRNYRTSVWSCASSPIYCKLHSIPCYLNAISITPKRSHYVFCLESGIFSFTCLSDQQISEHFLSVSHSVMHFLQRSAQQLIHRGEFRPFFPTVHFPNLWNSFLHFDRKLVTYSSRYSVRELSFLVYLIIYRENFRSSNVYSVVSWLRFMRLSWEMIKDLDYSLKD